MKLSYFFGWSDNKIKSLGIKAIGTVIDVKTMTAIKVNTRSVRKNALDGAEFPHIIEFAYDVNGKKYKGKRFLSYAKPCPLKDSKIEIYYDSTDPAKYAI